MSAPRCKPGDLAFVVGAVLLPEMNGRVVIVERAAVHNEVIEKITVDLSDAKGAAVWICTSAVAGGMLMALKNTGEKIATPVRPILDANLRPIRPDADDEVQRLAGLPHTMEPA